MSSAADFIWSEAPLDILGSVTSINFEGEASLPIKEHTLTTEEVAFFMFFLCIIFSLYLDFFSLVAEKIDFLFPLNTLEPF